MGLVKVVIQEVEWLAPGFIKTNLGHKCFEETWGWGTKGDATFGWTTRSSPSKRPEGRKEGTAKSNLDWPMVVLLAGRAAHWAGQAKCEGFV